MLEQEQLGGDGVGGGWRGEKSEEDERDGGTRGATRTSPGSEGEGGGGGGHNDRPATSKSPATEAESSTLQWHTKDGSGFARNGSFVVLDRCWDDVTVAYYHHERLTHAALFFITHVFIHDNFYSYFVWQTELCKINFVQSVGFTAKASQYVDYLKTSQLLSLGGGAVTNFKFFSMDSSTSSAFESSAIELIDN